MFLLQIVILPSSVLYLFATAFSEEDQRFLGLDEGQVLHFPSAFNARFEFNCSELPEFILHSQPCHTDGMAVGDYNSHIRCPRIGMLSRRSQTNDSRRVLQIRREKETSGERALLITDNDHYNLFVRYLGLVSKLLWALE